MDEEELIEIIENSENPGEINWDSILTSQNVSEEFLEKYSDYIGWDIISGFNLSEEFIGKHRYEINWDIIFEAIPFENFSMNFQLKYKDELALIIDI